MQLYSQPEVPCPAAVAELERRKQIQQHLVLLLHANKCRKSETQALLAGEWPNFQCLVRRCRSMKRVLHHLTSCQAGKDCTVSQCPSSRQIITHWKNCTLDNCAYCLPIKQLDINVTYDLNEAGEAKDVDLKQAFDMLNIPNIDVDDNPLKESLIKNYLCPDRRAHVVQKIALALLPGADASIYMDKRWHRLIAYATKLEGDMFELANTSPEYYHLLALKIFDLKKQLDVKRQLRRQQQRAAGGYSTPPESRPVTPPLR